MRPLRSEALVDLLIGNLDPLGYAGRRDLGDGFWVAVCPLTFGRARLVLATDDAPLDGW